MNIGIIAYHAACNYGAFLQLLSTVEFIKAHGDTPFIINWVPEDFKKDYEKRSSIEVRTLFAEMRNSFFPLTEECLTELQVAKIIQQNDIQVVIIGSDAVCQHHPFRERFHFPTRRVFHVDKPTSDRMYPNVFWGSFSKYLVSPIPIAIMSGSSQDSKFYYIHGRIKRMMKANIMSYVFISVRDEWTQKMVSYLTDGEIIPQITPDPVFAFNENCLQLCPTKDELIKKYNIPDDYILISFKKAGIVSNAWIESLEKIFEKHGLSCVKLPYADASAFGCVKHHIDGVLNPLDWYALIKYSNGYIGNNMHPIVVSIHNSIPFFSFDHYGIVKQNGESSKIFDLLERADLLKYRVFTKANDYKEPSPEKVFSLLTKFDTDKEQQFSQKCYQEYLSMMNNIYNSFHKENMKK